MIQVFKQVSKVYKGIVGARLKAAGLKYDDLVLETADFQKAMSRTTADVQEDRQRRIRRAFDLSAKKKACPSEVADAPLDFYIDKQLERAQLEREEREALNGY